MRVFAGRTGNNNETGCDEGAKPLILWVSIFLGPVLLTVGVIETSMSKEEAPKDVAIALSATGAFFTIVFIGLLVDLCCRERADQVPTQSNAQLENRSDIEAQPPHNNLLLVQTAANENTNTSTNNNGFFRLNSQASTQRNQDSEHSLSNISLN